MATQRQYLDLVGLSQYDTKLKEYIDSAKTLGIKKVLWDSTNEKIKFYRDPAATLDSTADFEMSVSSSDVQKLNERVGMDSTLKAYQSKSNLTDITNILTGAETVTGSVAKALKDAKDYTDAEIDKLDADVITASIADGIVTLTNKITETDGTIAKAGTDISLAKVATTGAAGDVTVADAAGLFVASNVEAALAEVKAEADTNKADIETLNSDVTTEGSVKKLIKDNAKDATYDATHTLAEKIAEVETQAVVTVEKQAEAETGYAATYIVKQNGKKVGDSINVAKDWLLKAVEIKTCETADTPVAGYKVGDRYFDFEFNVKAGAEETSTHIYLLVEEMYDAYTSGSAADDMVVVTVDNAENTISAAITDGTVTRAKIDSAFEKNIADLEATHAKSTGDATYKTVAEEIDEKINTLDATVSQNGVGTAEAGGTGLTLEIVETDGKLTKVSGSIETISEASINALFA